MYSIWLCHLEMAILCSLSIALGYSIIMTYRKVIKFKKQVDSLPNYHLPNIEKALKITVSKHGDEFRADPTALPGMPIVGRGKTETEAKYSLCVNWLYMIARYYSTPECYRHGSDSAFVPMIIDSLNEDMNKLGQVLDTKK